MSPDKTDILFLSHRYDIVSGGEKALLDMIKYVVSAGLKPHVIIGAKGNIVEYLDAMNVPYTEIFLPFWAHSGNDPSPFHFTSLNPTVNTTRQIVDLIRKLQPKLCVTNTIVMPWLGYASSLTQTPHAWFIHELGTAGFNFRYAIGEAETLRTVDILSDAIFYNSRFTAEYYLPHFSTNKDVRVVYPGGQPLEPTSIASPFDSTAYKIVTIGQIKPQKGQFETIKAIHALKKKGINAQVALLGNIEDEDYEKEILAFISKHKLEESVLLLGHQKNPSSYLAIADLCVVNAVNESFGRVAVESMFIGTPVIGAASAGTTEIIDDKTMGLLYEPHNIDDLTEKITQLYKAPEQAAAIAKHAKKTAAKRYSDAARYREFMNYFKSTDGSKTALDLSPLASSFIDFTATVELFNDRDIRLKIIENSRQWKLLNSVKGKLLGK